MEKEQLKNIARMLINQYARKELSEGYTPAGLHPYYDAEGKLLYLCIRLKHTETGSKWIRPFHIANNNQFVMGEPKFTGGKPLYCLDEIYKNPDAIVWITEGESCADKLRKLGLVATTSGSADSAASTDWSPLSNRNIIIWPDNDEAGLRYANEVVQNLQDLNCNIQLVDISQLNLPEKGDCVDWLQLNPNSTTQDLNNLPLVCPPTEHKESVKAQSSLPYNFKLKDDGLFYFDEAKEETRFISSRIEVTALVRDKNSENWGRLLEFSDADGNKHVWAMPMEMLKGTGDELRGELLRLGLEIAPGNRPRNLLLEYIITSKPLKRVCCVNTTGWHGSVFVLPERTIGDSLENMVYQSDHVSKNFSQNGTLEEWQKSISILCQKNSRLMLAVSCGFAAMLLNISGSESGGLHFIGESSSGKTTALRVAASVFGSPTYLNRWRATQNGLESLASLHCDSLLVLDELAQVEPKEAGEIAYMLANGSGKTRANRSGNARSKHTWRLLFLSAGEIGLSQHMNEAGKKIKAGQEVRLVDISADANKGHGIFEELHNFSSGSELSKALVEATSKHHGTAAIAFLDKVTKPEAIESLEKILKQLRHEFMSENLPENAGGQVTRVCERFALIAAAGEIATHYGITRWEKGEATEAAIICFQAWLSQRGGTGNNEEKSILAQIKSFFEQHGNSRFTDWQSSSDTTINRAGFKKRQEDQSYWFYVLPEAFKSQVCSGTETKQAIKALLKAGWLETGPNEESYRRESIPGFGRTRCYVINNKMWE